MAKDDKETKPNTNDRQESFSESDALKYIIDLCVFEANLAKSAIDSGKPEVAERIMHDFFEPLKNSLPDILRELEGALKLMQPILSEIENRGLKVIDSRWSTINEGLNSLRERHYISSEATNEDILADLFQCDSVIRRVPPGHSLLHLLGVENEGQWNKLTPAEQWEALRKVLSENKQPFSKVSSKLLHRWAQDSSVNSVSQEPVVHGDEVLERIEAKTEEPLEYLSDADRLQQFCEHEGIDMNTLTHGDADRLIDLLHALDPNIGGYELASKTGISLKDYYGDKADSEKTQRQRLFNKIKKSRDKAK